MTPVDSHWHRFPAVRPLGIGLADSSSSEVQIKCADGWQPIKQWHVRQGLRKLGSPVSQGTAAVLGQLVGQVGVQFFDVARRPSGKSQFIGLAEIAADGVLLEHDV